MQGGMRRDVFWNTMQPASIEALSGKDRHRIGTGRLSKSAHLNRDVQFDDRDFASMKHIPASALLDLCRSVKLKNMAPVHFVQFIKLNFSCIKISLKIPP